MGAELAEGGVELNQLYCFTHSATDRKDVLCCANLLHMPKGCLRATVATCENAFLRLGSSSKGNPEPRLRKRREQ